MVSETKQGEPGAGLAERWTEPAPEGGTRRDARLRELRAGSLSDRDLRSIRLAGEDLSGLDFSRCDLTGADLSGANLSNAKLAWATLQGAKLAGARLERAEFLSSDLGGADMTECRAERAGFGNANLGRAVLFGARMPFATFTKASLRQADLRSAQLESITAHEADLRGADFTQAVLAKADLGESRVEGATFVYANLREARLKRITGFEKAGWIGVDIRDLDTYGAYLVRRHIMDENYLHEFRNQGKLQEILYWVWWVTSDCGRSFARWSAWIGGTVLLFALLYWLVGLDYGSHEPGFLSAFYFSVVTVTTLGYGDVLPSSLAGQVLVIVHIIVGYLALGGLISILANKMARRAE